MSRPRFLADHDLNEHFFLSTGRSLPGLFMIQQALPIGPMIESLVLIWAASELEEWKDQVVSCRYRSYNEGRCSLLP